MLITRDIIDLIDAALAEDSASDDATTDTLIPPDLTGAAALVSRGDGVLAGVDVACAVFARHDPALSAVPLIADGSKIARGDSLVSVRGGVASILRAERTAVNFLQRLSGVATLTRRYVDAVRGCRAQIVDTRKTTPGLRRLEKYAVRMGGARNHRRNLADGILIKDNHIAALALQGLSIGDVVRRALDGAPHTIRVEVEVDTLEQLEEALDAGADLALLDNMSLAQMEAAVGMVGGRAVLEASGGVNLGTARAIAETGVDIISVGALTHSAPALDVGLDMNIDS